MNLFKHEIFWLTLLLLGVGLRSSRWLRGLSRDLLSPSLVVTVACSCGLKVSEDP